MRKHITILIISLSLLKKPIPLFPILNSKPIIPNPSIQMLSNNPLIHQSSSYHIKAISLYFFSKLLFTSSFMPIFFLAMNFSTYFAFNLNTHRTSSPFSFSTPFNIHKIFNLSPKQQTGLPSLIRFSPCIPSLLLKARRYTRQLHFLSSPTKQMLLISSSLKKHTQK